jgi:hypothetical protein
MKTIDAYFGNENYAVDYADIYRRFEIALYEGRLIQLCRTLGEGDLYESAALKFRASGYTISSKITTRDDLVSELDDNQPWKILACNIEGCQHHKPEQARFGVWV